MTADSNHSIVFQDELTGFEATPQTDLQPELPLIEVEASVEQWATEAEQQAADDDVTATAEPQRLRLVYRDGTQFHGPGKRGD